MDKKTTGIYRSLALVGSLGWTVFICVALGALLGMFVDNTFRTPPAFFVVGLILGIAAGFWQSYRLIMREIREDEPRKSNHK